MNNNNLRDVSEETLTNSVYWQDIQGKPEEFTPEYHTHAEYAKRYHKHNVADILGVEDFATSDHLHDDRYYTKEEIDTIVNEVSAPSDVYWDDIKNIPEKFPALEHTHNDEYYTKEEIDAKLRKYALVDHRHTIDDIDGDFEANPDNGNNGGNNDNATNNTVDSAYTMFLIYPSDFTEDEDGLFFCQVEHNFGTINIDAITKDLNGNFVLVDISCLDENNIILTAMDHDPVMLLAKKIAVK